jgi:hypothetical protein
MGATEKCIRALHEGSLLFSTLCHTSADIVLSPSTLPLSFIISQCALSKSEYYSNTDESSLSKSYRPSRSMGRL